MADPSVQVWEVWQHLSPHAREEAVAFMLALAEREGWRPLSEEERRRRRRETRGSIPPEEARELLRIGREEHDRVACDTCPSE